MIFEIILAFHIAFVRCMSLETHIPGSESPTEYHPNIAKSLMKYPYTYAEEDSLRLELGNTLTGNGERFNQMESSGDRQINKRPHPVAREIHATQDVYPELSLGVIHTPPEVGLPTLELLAPRNGISTKKTTRSSKDKFIHYRDCFSFNGDSKSLEGRMPYRLVVPQTPAKSIYNHESQAAPDECKARRSLFPEIYKTFEPVWNPNFSPVPLRSERGTAPNNCLMELELKIGQPITTHDQERGLTMPYGKEAPGHTLPEKSMCLGTMQEKTTDKSGRPLYKRLKILPSQPAPEETRWKECSYIERGKYLKEKHLFSSTCPGRREHSKVDIPRPSKVLENREQNPMNKQEDVGSKESNIRKMIKSRKSSYSRIPIITGKHESEVHRDDKSCYFPVSDNMRTDMDKRVNDSNVYTQGSMSSTFKKSGPFNPFKSYALTKNSGYTGTTHTYFSEGKVGIHPAEERKELINSYYPNFLRSGSFNHAFALAKTHITSQRGLSGRSSQEQKYIQIPGRSLQSHATSNTMEEVDEFIQKVFKETTLKVKRKNHLGRPLAFLGSVAYVKIDIRPELRDDIWTWFFNLREKLFQKLTISVGSDKPLSEKLESMVNGVLAKAHGQLLLCSMGAVLLFDYDTSNNLNHPEILKEFWNFLKDYLKGWEKISTAQMMESLNLQPYVQYSDKLTEDTYRLFQYYSRHRIDRPSCSRIIWYMVGRFLNGTGKNYAIAHKGYTHGHFVRRLGDVIYNMSSLNLDGVNQSKLSLHFIESNKVLH